jgi:hypothetical protein
MRIEFQSREPVAELRQHKGWLAPFECLSHSCGRFEQKGATSTGWVENTGCGPIDTCFRSEIKQPLRERRRRIISTKCASLAAGQ